MNHIYRLKFNRSRQTLTVVSELARGMVKHSGSNANSRLGQLSKLAILLLPLLGFCQFALAAALPTGASVVAGAANIQSNSQSMVINQHTDKLITNWQSFDIGKNNSVEFKQPSSSSVALNRISAGPASQILGNLKANGQVYLINPKGILFGKDAQVNVGSLVATTANIKDADFLNNKIALTDIASGGIINQGTLKVNQAGYIVLAAAEIKNEGTISASNGKVALAAGKKVTLNLDNGRLLSVDVSQETLNALIENKGLIAASNGQVYLTAKGARDLSKNVINLSGTVDVTAIRKTDQGIFIDGGDSGVTQLSGNLLASGKQHGGKVVMTGKQLLVSGKIEATGEHGGSVYLGGGWQGKDPAIRNADSLTFTDKASINVAGKPSSGGQPSSGGKAVLWSENATVFAGKVNFGNKGTLETSSRNWLSITGQLEGSGGHWLIDPSELRISDADTVPLAGASVSNIQLANFDTALNSGTSIELTGDTIHFDNLKYNYNNTGGNTPTLTIAAKSNLTINNSSIRSNTTASNPLSMTLTGKNISITNSLIDLRTTSGNGTLTSTSGTFLATNSTLVAGKVNISASTTSILNDATGTITSGRDSWQKRSNTNAVWIKDSRIAANNGDLTINATITLPAKAKNDLINASKNYADKSYPLFAAGNLPDLKTHVADSTKITRDTIPSENAITIINSVLQSKTANVSISGISGGEFSGVRLLGNRGTSLLTPPPLYSTDANLMSVYDFADFDKAAATLNGVAIKAAGNVTIYGESMGTASLGEVTGKYPSEGSPQAFLYARFGERGSLYLEGNVNIDSTNTTLTGNNKRASDPNYYPTGFAFYNLDARFNGKTDIRGYADVGNGISAWSKSSMKFKTPTRTSNYVHAISRRGSGLTFINFNYEGAFTNDENKANNQRAEIIKENVFNLKLDNTDFKIYAEGQVNGFYSGFSNNAVGNDAIESLNINSNSITIAGTGNVDAVGSADTGIGFSIKALDNTKLLGFVNITGVSKRNNGLVFSAVPKKAAGEDKSLLKYNVIGHTDSTCTSHCEDIYGINVFGFSESQAGIKISSGLTPDLPDSLALLQAKALIATMTDTNKATIMPKLQAIAGAHPDIAPFIPSVANSGKPSPLPKINITGVSTAHNGISIESTDDYVINLNGINLQGVTYNAGKINNSGIAIRSPVQFVNTNLVGISRHGDGVSISSGTETSPSMLIQSQLRGISGNQTGSFSGINLAGHITLLRSKMLDGGKDVPILQADHLTKANAFTLDPSSYNSVLTGIDGIYNEFNTLNTGDTLTKDDAPSVPAIGDDYYANVQPTGINIDGATIQGSAILDSNQSEHSSVGIIVTNSTIMSGIPSLSGTLDLSSVAKYFTSKLSFVAQGKTGAIVGEQSKLSNLTLNASTQNTSDDDDSAILLTGSLSLNGSLAINADNQKSDSGKNPVAIRINKASVKSDDPSAVTLTSNGIQNLLTIDDSILLDGFDTTSANRLHIQGVIAGLTATDFPAAKTMPLMRIGNAKINNTDLSVNASALTTAVTPAGKQDLTLFDLRTNKTTALGKDDKLTLVNSTINVSANYLTGVSINNSIDFLKGSKITVSGTDNGSATSKLPPSVLIGNFRQSGQRITLSGELADPYTFNIASGSPNIQLLNDAWMLINVNALSALNINNLAISGTGNNHIQKSSDNGGLSITNSVISNKVTDKKSSLNASGAAPDTGIGMWLSNVNLDNSRIIGESTNKDITALVINRLAKVVNSEITGKLDKTVIAALPAGGAALKIENDSGGLELTLSGSKITAQGPLVIKAAQGISLEKNSASNKVSEISSSGNTLIDAPYIGSRNPTTPPENKITVSLTDATDSARGASSAMLTLTNSDTSADASLTLSGLDVTVDSDVTGFDYGLLLDKSTKVTNGHFTIKGGDKLAIRGMDKLQDGEGHSLLNNLLVTADPDDENKASIANGDLVFNLTKPAAGDFTDNYSTLQAVTEVTALSPVAIPAGNASAGGGSSDGGSVVDPGVVPENPDLTPPSPPEPETPPTDDDKPEPPVEPPTDGDNPEPPVEPPTGGDNPEPPEVKPPSDSGTDSDTTENPGEKPPVQPPATEQPENPPVTPDTGAEDTTKPPQPESALQAQQQQTTTLTANLAANSKREFTRLSTSVETVHVPAITIEICDIAGECSLKQLEAPAEHHVASQP